ncbi:MAG: metal ABC transporter permease [Acidimicrobiales bacterium]|nr:metal ABC transporter permease [Acidimicrobiales bacterium]
MDWLAEPFEQAFMQRALIAGVLAVLATSIIGTWVVIRGLAFMGDALAHGVLPGVALAFLWGFNLTIGALASAAVMVGGISLVHRRARLAEDTAIGLLFVGMLALGVIIVSRARSFATELTGFLFGSILAVSPGDLPLLVVAAVVVVAGVLVMYRPFLALAFNWEKAESLGLRPRLAHVVMLGLVTVAIVASFRVVGTLLVFGLLIAPPATAQLLVNRVPAMMATSMACGVAAVVLGLELSYHYDLAASATMALVSVAGFFVVLVAREAWSSVGRRRISG